VLLVPDAELGVPGLVEVRREPQQVRVPALGALEVLGQQRSATVDIPRNITCSSLVRVVPSRSTLAGEVLTS
jgi:hypothetical protein